MRAAAAVGFGFVYIAHIGCVCFAHCPICCACIASYHAHCIVPHIFAQGELTEGIKALETGVRLLEQEHEATGAAADCLVTVRLETAEALRPRGKLAIPAALGGTVTTEATADAAVDAGPPVRVALLVSQTAAEEGVFHEMLGGFVGRAQEVRGQLTQRAAVTDQVLRGLAVWLGEPANKEPVELFETLLEFARAFDRALVSIARVCEAASKAAAAAAADSD